jgi:regulator of protease activity HflC (stomatin/prohibitin superfamily)
MIGLTLLILLVICVTVGVFCLIKREKFDTDWAPGTAFLVISALLLIGVFVKGVKSIDAGEMGLQVVFGKVRAEPLKEGLNFKSIFSEVALYETRIREITLGKSQDEDDPIKVLTKDKLEVWVEVTVWYRLEPTKLHDAYRNLGKDIREIESKFVMPAVRRTMRDNGVKHGFNDIIVQRGKYGKAAFDQMSSTLLPKGIIIDTLLVRNVMPVNTNLIASIAKKLVEQQELERKKFELEKTIKNAEIRKQEAIGIADAQNIIQKKLTPLYVQFEAIQAIGKLAKSPNTTFYIVPMSPNGAGIPLIMNAKK